MSTITLHAHNNNTLAILLACLLCFACLLVTCAMPTIIAYAAGSAATADSGPVDIIPMCAWARQGAVGLWWNTGVTPTRAFSNSRRYNAVCVAVPWSAALPDRGRPAIDVTP